MTPTIQRPLWARVTPDVLAFGLGLDVAYFFQWETRDLVWSLWLCSLVLGYLTILSFFGGAAYCGITALRQSEMSLKHRLIAVVVAVLGGLFLLGFFSLHFCGFHAGHSVFLRQFFPLEGLPRDGFGEAFMNPPLLWKLVFIHLLKPYGLFLIPAAIAERRHVFGPFVQAVRAARAGDIDGAFGKPPAGPKDNLLGRAMGRPYLNVVRMHLLIFFFAFCHFLKIESFIVFAVVYTVYFFPWSELKALKRNAVPESITE